MKKPDQPYVKAIPQKNGKTYYYFRRGKTYTRLPDNPDTPQFSEEYWKIRSGRTRASVKTTWGALISLYVTSPSFKAKSKGTQANYRRHCREIEAKNADADVRKFRRKHAIAARDALADSWSKANDRVAMLSILCKFAVDLEWIERNPVVDIPKLKGGEYEPWPEEALTAYRRYCESEGATVALTAMMLAVNTGQRLGDSIKMKWSDFDGEYMSVVQEKTGERIEVYCPDELRAYLAALPQEGAHILAKNLRQPQSMRAVQKAIEDVREALGYLKGPNRLVPHGWRYTAAVQLAEAGGSDSEIQAVTGHRTLEMVAKYRARASQKKASKRAQIRREQNKDGT